MNLVQSIKNADLFRNADPAALAQLAAHCHIKTYAKGHEIFTMGDKADAFFVIERGWIKLYRPSRDGDETIIHIFGPGESFAEAAIFNDGTAYPVNAQAIEESALVAIPRNAFVQQVEQESRFALHMLGAIAARQHYLVQQLEQVTTRTAPQRIGAFLIRFCRKEMQERGAWLVDLPYDKSIISTRLNIKPETFSRALAKLKPFGVNVRERSIIITDMEKLAEFCDLPIQGNLRL